jgi:glutathione synthase/RimK-type ligase-like ATP-grasp enzyme
MRACAFLTLDECGAYVIDDDRAIEPLAALGWHLSTLSWRQSEIPWSDFDLVVIRSTWDYWHDLDAFLETLERIDTETRLANPLQLVRWNLRKTYLRDLEHRSVPIVPTSWLQEVSPEAFVPLFDQLRSDELVIKPIVGANGDHVFRISIQDSPQRLQAIAARFQGKPAMLQRFMPLVLEEGEYSLFYFNGEYSHAVLKVPGGGEFRSQEERGAELRSVTPGEPLLQRGRDALEAINVTPLYARIDFVRNAADDFRLMEQELIEPSLYLRMDPAAPGRFAAAIEHRYG